MHPVLCWFNGKTVFYFNNDFVFMLLKLFVFNKILYQTKSFAIEYQLC